MDPDGRTSMKKSEPFWFRTNSDEQPYVFGIGKREQTRLLARNKDQKDIERDDSVRRINIDRRMPETYILSKREPYDFGVGK